MKRRPIHEEGGSESKATGCSVQGRLCQREPSVLDGVFPKCVATIISLNCLAVESDWSNIPVRGMSMSDPLADSTARLERLLRQLVAEKDADKADPLVEEVWEILAERDRIREAIAAGIKKG